MSEMPMFPLGTVLMPGMALPLQVFEPRYRTMMDEVLAGDRRFGVTLIERGSEVGGGDVRTTVGTVAEVVRADAIADGRWAVMSVGVHRIRVRRWLPDDPYPRAEVEHWPDEVSDTPERLSGHVAECTVLLRRIMALGQRLGHPTGPVSGVSDDPSVATFQLALLAPLGTLDRQLLLEAPGPAERLALLDRLFVEMARDLEALGGG